MDALFVERFPEPFTGQPLIGVGGYRNNGATVTVLFDGARAALLTPAPTDAGFHFAVQLPIEAGLKSVTVKSGDAVLFDATLDSIRWRHESQPQIPHSFGKRALKSLLSGQALSPSRWLARWNRYREKLLHFRQRLRTKLLKRSLPARSLHEAFLDRQPKLPATTHRVPPKISILMPVYQVEPKWFRAAVESVRAQSYPHWELCIADDASTRVDLLAEFDRLPDDPRIRFTRRTANGHICNASNSAADLATGDYIALLDHDDALAPDALESVARAINESHADLLYSDEDKIDAKGRHYDPQHKPEWSPELLLSYNYVNHFTVIRRELFEKAGRFRSGFEGSQDHDLLLRVTELTDRVMRIPRILYHWRSLPSSTASSAGVKSYVHTSGRRAVEDALKRRGINASLEVPEFAQTLGLPVLSLSETNETHSVAVIVYGPAAQDTLRQLAALPATIYYEAASDAESLNRIASARDEEMLVFVAAGVMPESDDWLARLLAYASIPGVGAVGGSINNSGGLVITPVGLREAFEHQSGISYYFYREVARNVTAPSRGVLLTPRRDFETAGGFDAERFPQSLFEADYCKRLAGLGRRSVHVGDTRFAFDNKPTIDPREWLSFKRAHGVIDSYSNPNFAEPFASGGDADLITASPKQVLSVLVAAHNLNSPEGAPRYLSEIIFGLRDRGVLEPGVISPRDGAGAAVYRTSNVPVTILEGEWTTHLIDAQWSPRSYEACQRKLLSQLQAQKPQAVIANTLLMFPVVEAAARLGIPSVWIIHESYSQDVLNRLFTPYAQSRMVAAFALASRIVPASHDTAALFRPWDVRHGIRVIHNGIDPAAIDAHCRQVNRREACERLGLDPQRFHAVAVGTVCERKGQHTLVDAAAKMGKHRRDFTLHLVGMREEIPYANYLRHLVERRGVSDCVNLVSETGRVFDWYRAADAYVCTSHMETFSRSILEAEAFALPVVSTPCEGIGEQVVWNQNALRFEKNDAAMLATHLQTLIANPALCQTMGKKSRAVFDSHHSYEQMLDEYQTVLLQACPTAMSESRSLLQRAAS